MTAQGLLRLAWKESRTARRRLALYMSSIALGVTALVAIDSFAGNVTSSIREQSRTLLGGDLGLDTRAAFTPSVDSLLDSLSSSGIKSARLTSLTSMALSPRTGGTRLVQLRAAGPGFPFYGVIETEPSTAYARQSPLSLPTHHFWSHSTSASVTRSSWATRCSLSPVRLEVFRAMPRSRQWSGRACTCRISTLRKPD
jgi:predicted lysophospholipase L1 biosynthesis ABC-type transport system permease subunit